MSGSEVVAWIRTPLAAESMLALLSGLGERFVVDVDDAENLIIRERS